MVAAGAGRWDRPPGIHREGLEENRPAQTGKGAERQVNNRDETNAIRPKGERKK
jgi:hypothetical protein